MRVRNRDIKKDKNRDTSKYKGRERDGCNEMVKEM
jgi:hypothetical protein